MRQGLKCRFGWHIWNKWSEIPHDPNDPGKLYVQTRTCSFCGLSQRKLVMLRGFSITGKGIPVEIGEDDD